MTRRVSTFAVLLLGVLPPSACSRDTTPSGTPASSPAAPATGAALDSLTTTDLLRHTERLASDEFEGRAPGSNGEELTVAYLTEQFRAIGLKPGNPDGTFIQNVSLVGLTTSSSASLTMGRTKVPLKYPADYVAVSRRVTPAIDVTHSPLVFVGYGVVAPEYNWDDYKGVDVKGKTLVMLVNDPPVPSAADPSKLDEGVFKGRAMTYYGRWTYKYEIAAEKGAAAAIIVHETGPAGYPWEVVTGSWGHENFDIQTPDRNMGRAAVESWMHLDRARSLFAASGQDFDALKRAAATRAFKPVALDASATFHLKNTIREIQSRNVVARLEGSDPDVRDEWVVYTAHWDHLGKDESLRGDQIFNGALDNASGTAGLLELAEAFTRLTPAPRRSILFLAVTAEESGLLGARYYATSPLYPLAGTLANINMDGVNQWGRTKDIVVVGWGNSTLDDLLAAAARRQGRVITPDPEPEKGFFYRSDHFEFAKQGVPALYPDSGIQYVGKPEGYGQQRRDEYTARDYHKVSDTVKPDWDLTGAVDDLRLLFEVGLEVAQTGTWPEWKPGTEFRARRQAMLRGPSSTR
jgi:Zn-dependent M28 family amino/carboxypeptidase